MSGILKSIGKVFKRVVKVVRKIAPYALAIGAVVLTGGAALGALPAMGTMLGGLGLSAGLTATLSSAVTAAGIGGALGFVTGGKKGLLKGALIGGITGGAAGALGAGLNVGAGTLHAALPGAGGGFASIAPSVLATPALDTGIAGITAAAPAGVSAAASAALPGAFAPTVSAGGGGLLSSVLSNPTLIGGALQGIGSGVSAKAEAKSQKDALDRRAANYGLLSSPTDYGNLTPPTVDYSQSNAPTAAQKYANVTTPVQWGIDPQTGKIVRVPVAMGA